MAFPSSPKLRSRGGVNSSRGVKIFRSLLLISLLEGILWSLCLFHSASACGVAYYERETVNLKSTTALRVLPPPPNHLLETRALLLALRDEARARQRTLEDCPPLPASREQIAQLATLRAFLPLLGERSADSGADGAADAALLTVAPARSLRAHARRAL